MKLIFKLLYGLCLCGWLLPSNAAGLAQNPFDETTWAKLVQNGPRPAAYLFTTSYCSTCPDVFDQLHRYVRSKGKKVELVAVIMDVSGPVAQRHAGHFAGLTRLYVFDGFETAIRQSVDPQWPDVTPYVVLIDKQGRSQKTLGDPSPGMLRQWLP